MSYLAQRFQHSQQGFSLNAALLAKYPDIIDLSIGDPDPITDAQVIDTAFQDAKAGYTHYGDPQGDPALIAAIQALWRDDYGQSVSAEEILITASSGLGMSLALMAILNPGEEVIVFSPYFPVYRQQIELAGGVCVEVPTYAEEAFAIRETRLRSAITPRTRAIIFNNPCNPTGKAYSPQEYDIVARAARAHHLLVLSDEIYTSYLAAPFVPFRTLPGMASCTVTLNSFSKDYLMSGWRLGSVIAPAELIGVMQYINSTLVYAAPSISQRAAVAAIKRREELHRRNREIFLPRIAYAAQRIQSIPYLELVPPQGTFYLFPDAKRTGLSSRELCDAILERAHVLVSPGQVFGSAGQGHFRIACTVAQDTLCEAFDRMERLTF